MPVIRVNDDGLNRKKENAKKASLGIAGVTAIAIASFVWVSPEVGLLIGLIAPTAASLLNLWSD